MYPDLHLTGHRLFNVEVIKKCLRISFMHRQQLECISVFSFICCTFIVVVITQNACVYKSGVQTYGIQRSTRDVNFYR